MGPDNSKDIWILGAGFSRQLYRSMPLMSDLAESVRDVISDRFDNSLVLDNVELALSELRSEAPWKSPIAKYADLALYERVVERTRDQLQIPWNVMRDDRENLAHSLVNTWHIGEVHVLTFNYDHGTRAGSHGRTAPPGAGLTRRGAACLGSGRSGPPDLSVLLNS